jgi:hypothetical protein
MSNAFKVLSDSSYKRDALMFCFVFTYVLYLGYKQIFNWFASLLILGLLYRYFYGYINACNKITFSENLICFRYWYKKQWNFIIPISDINEVTIRYGATFWPEKLLGVNMNLILFEANNQKYQVVFSRGPRKMKLLKDFFIQNNVKLAESGL